MYKIICFLLIVTGAQAFDFNAFKSTVGKVAATGGVAALNTYAKGGSASSALTSGFNKSVSTLTTKPPATLLETVNSTKTSLLAAYGKHARALEAINPDWKKDIETTYGALNTFSKTPVTDAASQTKIQAFVAKANNIMKLAPLLIKMNGAVKPNDLVWNTVIDVGTITKTSDLASFDDLTSALTALTSITDEFQSVLDVFPFSDAVKASMDMLTQYTTTPSIDAAINKQLQAAIITANNQAKAIPTICASLASENYLSPGDEQWSFLEPQDKSKKYDQNGHESTGSISYDPLNNILSGGVKSVSSNVKEFAKDNEQQLKTLAMTQAFAQTKAKQEPILTEAIARSLASLQQVIGTLDSDSSTKLETINYSPKLFANLLDIFSKNLHLTSPLQVENLAKLVKMGETVSLSLPYVARSQWTVLPGNALWSTFTDAQGKNYTLAELASVAASQNINQAVNATAQTITTTGDAAIALSALQPAYQQYETQLKASLEQKWITSIEQTGTQLDTLSKATTPDSSAASAITTANNMVKAFPMLTEQPGSYPGDEQWSTLMSSDAKRYDLEGNQLS